jgi:hypothetical protein
MDYVAGYSHVIETGSGNVTLIHHAEVNDFALRLRQFDGVERFALCLWALPAGMDYDRAVMAGQDALEYLQAAGRADRLTVEIRKSGSNPWGAQWVRYVVGHGGSTEVLDVPVVLPAHTEMICDSEVFTADEAAELFQHYFESGAIPSTYSLRPVEGYTSDGGFIDLREATS